MQPVFHCCQVLITCGYNNFYCCKNIKSLYVFFKKRVYKTFYHYKHNNFNKTNGIFTHQ